MQRTIRIELEPSPIQAAALAETSRQFTAVFNTVCAYGWQQNEKNGIELHRALYYPLKTDYPALVSDLHVQARIKATEAVRSALALRHKYEREHREKKVSQPQSAACPPRYNLHTYRIDWESRTVRMSLVGGRQTIRFRVQDYAAKYVGHPVDTADLIEREGRWWLHVVVTVPAPEIQPTDHVVGIDLGINRPAVTSNNQFLGKRRWKAVEAATSSRSARCKRRAAAPPNGTCGSSNDVGHASEKMPITSSVSRSCSPPALVRRSCWKT